MILVFLLAAASSVQAGQFSVDAVKMVKAHNEVREVVGSPKVKWSKMLETKAEGQLKILYRMGCTMRHFGGGENLFWASALQSFQPKKAAGQSVWQRSPQKISENDVVAKWADERIWYSSHDNTCHAPEGKSCGHFTQIVWRKTTEIGCGRAICDDNSQIWLCIYFPVGNIEGETPY